MVRALFIFALLAALAFAGYWFGHNPGDVSITWRGWQVDTSVGVMIVAVGALVVVAALTYRLWRAIRRAPRNISRYMRERRRSKGYLALTQGMAAVAAGDAKAAQRFDDRAKVLLNDPPITLLLTAQAAQLNDNEAKAAVAFRAMLEKPETEFLGLRGLLTQAMKNEEWDEALRLARRAVQLSPKTAWAQDVLFELETHQGNWRQASAALQGAARHKLVARADAKHREAVLETQHALDRAKSGDKGEAQKALARALQLDPSFAPAMRIKVKLLADEPMRNARKIQSALDTAWQMQPCEELGLLLLDLKKGAKASERMKAVERLGNNWPDHLESRLVKARAALDGDLWGEARRHLETACQALEAADRDLPARLCRLIAELEEAEHHDMTKSRDWLIRASLGEGDPAWVCSSCGHVSADWSALCPHCDGFDSLVWRVPPHLPSALRLSTGDPMIDALAKAEGTAAETALVTVEDAPVPDDPGRKKAPPPPPQGAHS
ncbi:MAG: heme biosynthesis protein HemY [Rhodospirillales bacterium]